MSGPRRIKLKNISILIISVIAFITLTNCNSINNNEFRLPIYTPADLDPDWVDPSLKNSTDPHIVNDFEFEIFKEKLLGKEDATTRIFRTVANLSNDIFNAKLYDDLYKAGNNKIFFTPKQAEKFAASAKTQRQKDDFFRFQSATIEGAEFGALNGLKSTPEIARLFNTVNKSSFRKGAEQVYSMFLMAKGYGQAAATVGNLYTHLRLR